MGKPLAIATIGAGRVLQRLYLPALASVPGLRLTAAADVSPASLAALPPTVATFDRLEGMLDRPLDGLLILSPGRLHHDHAAAGLERGLPVLLEKPSAQNLDQLYAWPESWRPLVTPARPRRYWREYLALRRTDQPGVALSLELSTSPGAWGSSTTDSVEQDLLPHVHDLAGWLTRTRVVSVDATATAARVAGAFQMSDGRSITFDAAHAGGYVERVTVGGVVHDLSQATLAQRIRHRLSGTPSRDVEGVARMLRLWERRLRGESPPGLPGFGLAVEELTARAQLTRPAD